MYLVGIYVGLRSTLHVGIMEIHRLQSLQSNPQIEMQEAQLQVDLQEALKNEEQLWRTKSHTQWLATSELNTRFFHLSTLIRRRKNCIKGLKTENGRWLNNREDLGAYLCSNFQTIFSTSSPAAPDDISNLFSPIISADDNDFLCRVPDEAEILSVIQSIGASKAPGLDGISALFYHTYWSIMKFDVVTTFKCFFASSFLLKSLNHTNIMLIPKNDNPTLVSLFRPISLCNVLYKTISKILAIRLKSFLLQIISPIQTGLCLTALSKIKIKF